jgi:hypothetical protein
MMIYGQTEVTLDLMNARRAAGLTTRIWIKKLLDCFVASLLAMTEGSAVARSLFESWDACRFKQTPKFRLKLCIRCI